jgi:glycosyltransferase involved in cell wall biosynthesis
MRRILIISTSYPASQSSGAEAAGSFVADFAEELSRHLEVTVVAPGKMNSREDCKSLSVRRFACARLPLSLLNPVNPRDWCAILDVLRRGRQLVDAVTHETRFDHVLALWALPSGYWARCVWRASGVPYSVWTLGSDIWTLGKIPFVRSLLSVVLRDAATCFSDGLVLRDDTVRIAGGRSCHFLPSIRRLPVVTRGTRDTGARMRLAFLGRWHPNKGIDLLLEALEGLGDTEWSAIEEVRICGGGPMEALVHERCDRLNHQSRQLTVTGFLDKNEAAALLAWADYLVIPSRIESIPVIFSDAIQAGCPVLATPVGDLPRLVSRYKVGMIAEAVSSTAIQILIRRAIAHPTTNFEPAIAVARGDFSVEGACRAFLNSYASDGREPEHPAHGITS